MSGMQEVVSKASCGHCKKPILHIVSCNSGQEYRCPVCGKVMDYIKGIQIISNLSKPRKISI